MKVSEWLREYQLTGKVPEAPKGEELLAFWAGWLIGHAGHGSIVSTMDQRIQIGITIAEFIEEHAK